MTAISGFQATAFQRTAFQFDNTTGGPAFQSGAFQGNAFQTSGAATPSTQRYVPGHKEDQAPHYPRYRSQDEIRRDREALWDIPKPAEKAVAKVAQRVIAKVKTAQQEAQTQHIDPLQWLAANQAQQRAALEQELKARQVEFSLQYMILLRLEVERVAAKEQDEEDEQIVMLLMEM